MKPTTLPPSRTGVRFLFLLASLACSRFLPPVPPTVTVVPAISTSSTVVTVTPGASVSGAYLGQFDCQGLENGLSAYSGRITVQPGGQVTFKDYDGSEHTGAWTYDAPGHTLTFSGNTPLGNAVYDNAHDRLAVVLAPNAKVVHADNGSMSCQRAVPGQTGPP